MEHEPFVKKRFDWKKQFTEVTPFSKYLALLLFIALPFIGFFLGAKYESLRITIYDPVIIERVFEKEVVVEKASTSTPEVKIIIFTGAVREGGKRGCYTDGVCSTFVSEYEVIWQESGNSQPRGAKEVVYPGEYVEVFGQVIEEGIVTLYGNENYYLMKTTAESASNKDQGLEKVLRGELMVYFEDAPGCEKDAQGRRCFKEIKVYTTNAWEYRDYMGIYDEGILNKRIITDFIEQVSTTELIPLTENSPCDDVKEAVGTFTFYTELGVVRLDQCQIEGDNSPLFRSTLTEMLELITNNVES